MNVSIDRTLVILTGTFDPKSISINGHWVVVLNLYLRMSLRVKQTTCKLHSARAANTTLRIRDLRYKNQFCAITGLTIYSANTVPQ